MNKFVCLFMIVGFSIQGSAAERVKNLETVNQIKSYFFDEHAKTGAFVENGLLANNRGAPTGEACRLQVSLMPLYIEFTLRSGGSSISFKADELEKASRKLTIDDADENYVIASQVVNGRSEQLKALTLESIGDDSVNNVNSIEITAGGETTYCVFSASRY